MKRLTIVLSVMALLVVGAAPALSQGPHENFRTHLSGDNEVPAVETQAQGQAIFKLSADGESLDYKLIVANIENVFMAHIHIGPEDDNGPIAVWLYPDSPPDPITDGLIPGRTDGVLAEGTITANDLTGPLTGASMEDLLTEIEDGNAYVNVHTSQFGGGEIRGQIR